MTTHHPKTRSTIEQTAYLVGIDLGTTNSAVAYVDSSLPKHSLQPFAIPQLTRLGFVEQRAALPSFCYLLMEDEMTQEQLQLPWLKTGRYVVGEFAKTQGTQVPTRLVTSAKSWLCHGGIDRRERVLPTLAEEDLRISPLEATRRYLAHIRDAWNHRMGRANPEFELESQEVVLTVPASFDEVARTLTAQAAHDAGLTRVTLLEEPLAAFYNWLRLHQNSWQNLFQAGEHILVCDVGGGTTDFTLIRVEKRGESLSLERLSVGDHLLLGGDNFDNAIAHFLASKLFPEGVEEIEPSQWLRLCHHARQAKEALLAEDTLQKQYTVTLQGSGSQLVGGSQSATISDSELSELLIGGFFGKHDRSEALQLRQRSGVTTLGLPYEAEPSITKHLANFLFGTASSQSEVFPDYILFNGGSLKPPLLQQALIDSISNWWQGKTPRVLESPNLDLSVSKGAAYYGIVRRGEGVRVGGGLPRTYYLEVEVEGQKEKKALALLPRGSEEGTVFQPDQLFLLQANQPISFTLLTSHVRLGDVSGQLVDCNEEQMQALPPLHTILRYGKGKSDKLSVQLRIELTAIGTVALSLEAVDTEHSWRLDFQIRKASGQEDSLASFTELRQDEELKAEHVNNCLQIVNSFFVSTEAKAAKKLMERLEEAAQLPRRDWPPSLLRALADQALSQAQQRHTSGAITRRWWNLVGFCLRPGKGYPLDDHRLQQLWKIILQNLHGKADDIETQLQRYICYRRVAPGLTKGQQTQIGSALFKHVQSGTKKNRSMNGQERYQRIEALRTLAAFERLDLSVKKSVATILIEHIRSGTAESSEYWALGRIAARQPLYASSAHVVPRSDCIGWVEQIISLPAFDEQLLFPLGQKLQRTGHPEVDLPEVLRQKVRERLTDSKQLIQLDSYIENSESEEREQQEIRFGEALPPGLTLTQDSATKT